MWPALAEFLSLSRWEDGEARETGSVTVFVDAGMWKACLSDKDGKRVAFLSARTPEGLFEALEEGLQADRLDWRAQREQGGSRSKKT